MLVTSFSFSYFYYMNLIFLNSYYTCFFLVNSTVKVVISLGLVETGGVRCVLLMSYQVIMNIIMTKLRLFFLQVKEKMKVKACVMVYPSPSSSALCH